MKIWILYYSILFLHISISYNFICLIIFFFYYYSIQFYFKKYFLNNTDGVTDDLNLSIFSRELEKIYCICHNHRQTNSIGDLPMGIPTDSIHLYFPESWKKFTAYATISDGHM